MEWRTYDPPSDRVAAHSILRDQLDRGLVPHTIHPGEWDWWTFHTDPKTKPSLRLIGEHALAEVAVGDRIVTTFGVPAAEAIALGERHFGDGGFSVGFVSRSDDERIAELRSRGFTTESQPEVLLERSIGKAEQRVVHPTGFEIRSLRGEEEHASRAAAARRAFNSTMDPEAHSLRYLRFMRSPAYAAERDVVAVAPNGRVASFAIHWPDVRLSLGQFEPVGTDPEFQRRGLSRAVLTESLNRLARLGIARARVATGGDNIAAIACYQACGFRVIDRVGSWGRATTPDHSA